MLVAIGDQSCKSASAATPQVAGGSTFERRKAWKTAAGFADWQRTQAAPGEERIGHGGHVPLRSQQVSLGGI